MRTRLRSTMGSAVASIALAALPACTGFLYDDRCGIEGRDVSVISSVLTGPGDTLAFADFQMSETREDGSRSVYWTIRGAPLSGHLDNARLVATEDTSRVLLTLTGGPAEPDYVLDGHSQPYAGPTDFNELFDRARVGGLTVLLATDLPSHRAIPLPLLEVVQFNDWGRPHCS